MNRFIEIHDPVTEQPELVNINAIESVYTVIAAPDALVTRIDVIDGGCYDARESYDEIKNMIINLIHQDVI